MDCLVILNCDFVYENFQNNCVTSDVKCILSVQIPSQTAGDINDIKLLQEGDDLFGALSLFNVNSLYVYGTTVSELPKLGLNLGVVF